MQQCLVKNAPMSHNPYNDRTFVTFQTVSDLNDVHGFDQPCGFGWTGGAHTRWQDLVLASHGTSCRGRPFTILCPVTAAIWLHTLPDPRRSIPSFIHIPDGKLHTRSIKPVFLTGKLTAAHES
jgi:hypothetical protein